MAWLVTYTPLHAFWAGTEAVFVFFVLSGFFVDQRIRQSAVLLAFLLPSRLLRLYLPVVGALAFAAAVVAAVPRRVTNGRRGG